MASDRLSNVLDRLGAELDRVADRLRALAPHLDPNPEGPVARSPSHMIGLQDIDAMEQTIRDLAVALTSAADTEAATGLIDLDRLARGLRLSAIDDLIRGRTTPTVAASEVDFFD